ncbi:D-alanyl-D-alanine carboxypeptidase family protein [Veillonella intestinalis]|uniref:D-alanyl-D-alanine carboxypeptidase family protein n=1 Tax=Veillonella intestinalis TaxID=2941341 RepID=UPI002040186E|nr:D-alanyl-D-alanine carboxypeptidase family protein [Veillonella intestinalis]
MKCCKKIVWPMLVGLLVSSFSMTEVPVLAATTSANDVVVSNALPVPSFAAEAAVLIEAETGRVLVSHNANKRLHPASTTKMVTLLTALKHQGTRLDELATISPYAASMEESNLGVRTTDQLPLQAVAEGMMVASGNDAAVVVAENVSGSVYRFSLAMNEMAKEAGATNSYFLNPHGLTEMGHYSTAMDLAKIAAYGMRMPMFRDFVGDDFYKVPYENRSPQWVRTTNHFIRSKYAGANGLKTGYTEAAGECLIASATRDGRTLIVVLLNDDNRWVDAPALLDYGFAVLNSNK